MITIEVNNYYSKVICSEGGTLNIFRAFLAVTPCHGSVSYYLKWSVRKVLTAQGIELQSDGLYLLYTVCTIDRNVESSTSAGFNLLFMRRVSLLFCFVRSKFNMCKS